jgi:aryl-alcohol dehydrogenase-like predicted oxidoreductase
MRLASRRERQDLLAAAFDAGIRHFDVARMYGLGAAEAELALFARDKRDRMTIATKFGIEASPAPWMTRLQSPARALLARFPTLRRAVKRRGEVFQQSRRYDSVTAQASLEKSLRELGTDYVDILFLHAPNDPDEVAIEELDAFLRGAHQAGQIRAWGVAGEPGPLSALAPSFPSDAVFQVRDDIFSHPPPRLDPERPRITFGVLSSALERIVAHVRASEQVRRNWNGRVGADCSDPEVVSSLLLRNGVQSNSRGTVLFGTTKPERTTAAAAAVELELDPALEAFQDLVSTELVGRPEVTVRG